ncbi:MAG TPA: ZIP family metal transporter [bacterium]|nr:ZIP family metal transporter [bacterium]
MNFSFALLAVLIISLISIVGILTLGLKQKVLQRALIVLVAFSAGALIGDSFIHLLPEAIESSSSSLLSIGLMAGIAFFFVLEKVVRWRHCHDVSCSDHPRHLGALNLVADGLHNFFDGVVIGASFLVSLPLGIATTLAVALHEIPQELGDFGVLLHSGFTVKKAVLFNFLSALASVLGLGVVYMIGQGAENFIEFMIPFTIGGFLYIALSDLVPELHREVGVKRSLMQLLGLFSGILVMALLLFWE